MELKKIIFPSAIAMFTTMSSVKEDVLSVVFDRNIEQIVNGLSNKQNPAVLIDSLLEAEAQRGPVMETEEYIGFFATIFTQIETQSKLDTLVIDTETGKLKIDKQDSDGMPLWQKLLIGGAVVGAVGVGAYFLFREDDVASSSEKLIEGTAEVTTPILIAA